VLFTKHILIEFVCIWKVSDSNLDKINVHSDQRFGGFLRPLQQELNADSRSISLQYIFIHEAIIISNTPSQNRRDTKPTVYPKLQFILQ
jgi:hypothetical protein